MADPFLYERVYDYLLEEVRRENLKPGDRVPSEKELAERFGVSRITSKRALHMLAEAGLLDRRRGKGTFVTNDARRRLEALPARAPRQRRSATCLGLVLPDASEAYGLDLLCAIEERCAELGYHLVVRRTRDQQEVEEKAIQSLVGDGVVDGLIVFPVHGEFYNASLVRLVLDRAPLVLVDRHLPGIPACAVHTDNVAAAYALTTYLLDHGHEQLAFVSPPTENTSSIEERIEGYASALRERGLSTSALRRFTDVRSTLPGGGGESAEAIDRAALRDFVERAPEVTGFVACEYTIAVLLWEVLGEASCRRYAIACFDSPRLPSRVPAFAHIRQDQQAMGRRAVDLLAAQLAGEEVPPPVGGPLRSRGAISTPPGRASPGHAVIATHDPRPAGGQTRPECLCGAPRRLRSWVSSGRGCASGR